jgi:transposase
MFGAISTPKEEIPREGIFPELGWCDQERLLKELRSSTEASRKTRLLVIVNLVHGRRPTAIAEVLQTDRSTVSRVAKRFRERGLLGLPDGRRPNGRCKVTGRYLSIPRDVVGASPLDYGWQRPTWTREPPVATLSAKTGVTIHAATMSRALHRIRAGRGRPKPTVRCPWPESRKRRRLCEIRRLVVQLPANAVAVYQDEVDIHLNPKVGCDWTVRRQQKEVETPGKNVKRYLAGALDARTNKLIWVERDRKTGMLFVRLLWKLVGHYRHAKVIHVILDNCSTQNTSPVATRRNAPKPPNPTAFPAAVLPRRQSDRACLEPSPYKNDIFNIKKKSGKVAILRTIDPGRIPVIADGKISVFHGSGARCGRGFRL